MNKCDVLIVGGGPAGAVAGTILARGGARVRIVDRAAFPRSKLCGDTVNPGAMARLRALGLAAGIDAVSLRVDGMRVTGERGVAIEGRYPRGVSGRAITRTNLDWLLLQQAIAAGCEFDPGVTVRRAIVTEQGRARTVGGVIVGGDGHEVAIPARVTLAADGRHSTIAFGLGLAFHPPRPRRWAIGAYFEDFAPDAPDTACAPVVDPMDARCAPDVDPVDARCASDVDLMHTASRSGVRRMAVRFGEMHVRRGHYIGIAPVPGGLTNVCLVKASGAGDAALGDPSTLLAHALAVDPLLRDRAAGARAIGSPVILGPLAVEVRDEPVAGLLLAGDAAGFIDPMTGDGLRFATHGAELAAAAALTALEHGWTGVPEQLANERRRAFGAKWRFNRALRSLVSSPRAVNVAALGALLAPPVLRAVICRAGDC